MTIYQIRHGVLHACPAHSCETPAPYETDHQVPWGYGLEVVTSTGVKIEPEVAERPYVSRGVSRHDTQRLTGKLGGRSLWKPLPRP
ncbi:hypothetical protein Dimus_037032, partial [Dionaea muscipula]